jgi:glycosyltransferase involved in cell wall biosynthesis
MKIDVSIIIPCYNEERHLLQNVQEIVTVMKDTKYSFELIFVDDCSKDNTREKILEAVKLFPENSRYLFNETNTGRGGTFMNGVMIGKGEYVGFLDIDLEISPIFIEPILHQLDHGIDVATLERYYNISYNPKFIIRLIMSKTYKMIVRMLLRTNLRDTETGFKFFRKASLLAIAGKVKNKKWFWDTEVMTVAYLSKLRIAEVKGVFEVKNEKKSTVRIIPDTFEYFKEIIKFSRRIKNEKFYLLAPFYIQFLHETYIWETLSRSLQKIS